MIGRLWNRDRDRDRAREREREKRGGVFTLSLRTKLVVWTTYIGSYVWTTNIGSTIGSNVWPTLIRYVKVLKNKNWESFVLLFEEKKSKSIKIDSDWHLD